jgi:hypothetical protein
LAPPRLSLPRKVEAEAQAVATSSGTVRPGGEDLRLERGDVGLVDQRWSRRDRVLPDQLLGRHQRAEVAGARAHVAVGQLEPGAGEGVGELVGFSRKRREIFS